MVTERYPVSWHTFILQNTHYVQENICQQPDLSVFHFGASYFEKKKELSAFVSIYRLSVGSAHLMSYSWEQILKEHQVLKVWRIWFFSVQ